MSKNMSIMQYASKFIELSRFVPDFVAIERMKMRGFEEGLAFHIRHQLSSQPIHSYQDLYERAVDRVEGHKPKPEPSKEEVD